MLRPGIHLTPSARHVNHAFLLALVSAPIPLLPSLCCACTYNLKALQFQLWRACISKGGRGRRHAQGAG